MEAYGTSKSGVLVEAAVVRNQRILKANLEYQGPKHIFRNTVQSHQDRLGGMGYYSPI